MGEPQTQTSTSSSGSSDPQVKSTLDQLLGGVSSAFTAGPKVFNQSLYAGVGPTTTGAESASLAAANNPAYASGVNSGLSSTNNLINSGGLTSGQTGAIGTTNGITSKFDNLANGATAPSLTEQTLLPVAQGADLGQNDPGYAALRSKLSSDVMGDVGSSFTNSGRFGGGSFINAETDDLTNALAPLDYQQYQDSLTRQNNALSAIEGQRQTGVTNQANDLSSALTGAGSSFNMGQTGVGNQSAAISQLPQLFSALQAPSATAGAVGSAQDANAQGTLSGNADLYNRQSNSLSDLISRLTGAFNGVAGAAGTTTSTTTPTTPWWQSALGLGAALA